MTQQKYFEGITDLGTLEASFKALVRPFHEEHESRIAPAKAKLDQYQIPFAQEYDANTFAVETAVKSKYGPEEARIKEAMAEVRRKALAEIEGLEVQLKSVQSKLQAEYDNDPVVIEETAKYRAAVKEAEAVFDDAFTVSYNKLVDDVEDITAEYKMMLKKLDTLKK